MAPFKLPHKFIDHSSGSYIVFTAEQVLTFSDVISVDIEPDDERAAARRGETKKTACCKCDPSPPLTVDVAVSDSTDSGLPSYENGGEEEEGEYPEEMDQEEVEEQEDTEQDEDGGQDQEHDLDQDEDLVQNQDLDEEQDVEQEDEVPIPEEEEEEVEKPEPEEPSPEVVVKAARGRKRSATGGRGRPAKSTSVKRGRKAMKVMEPETETEPEPEEDHQEPDVDDSVVTEEEPKLSAGRTSAKKGRKPRKPKQSIELPVEQEIEPEHEPETEMEPEPEEEHLDADVSAITDADEPKEEESAADGDDEAEEKTVWQGEPYNIGAKGQYARSLLYYPAADQADYAQFYHFQFHRKLTNCDCYRCSGCYLLGKKNAYIRVNVDEILTNPESLDHICSLFTQLPTRKRKESGHEAEVDTEPEQEGIDDSLNANETATTEEHDESAADSTPYEDDEEKKFWQAESYGYGMNGHPARSLIYYPTPNDRSAFFHFQLYRRNKTCDSFRCSGCYSMNKKTTSVRVNGDRMQVDPDALEHICCLYGKLPDQKKPAPRRSKSDETSNASAKKPVAKRRGRKPMLALEQAPVEPQEQDHEDKERHEVSGYVPVGELFENDSGVNKEEEEDVEGEDDADMIEDLFADPSKQVDLPGRHDEDEDEDEDEEELEDEVYYPDEVTAEEVVSDEVYSPEPDMSNSSN